MSTINFIIQSVDGIGKTFVASLIAEYLQAEEQNFDAYDTCNDENSLSNFSGLSVQKIELFNDNGDVKSNIFDRQILAKSKIDSNIILDIAASGFENFSQFLLKEATPNLIVESKKEDIVHVVITGGDMQNDTLNGLLNLLKILPTNTKIMVWLNEYFGPIEAEGKTFTELKLYKNNSEKIHGIIKIRAPESKFFKVDLNKKNEQKLTLEEAINSDEFCVASKHRLRIIQHELFEQLNEYLAPFLTLKTRQKIVDFGTEKLAQTPSKNEPIIATQTHRDEVASKYIDAINSSFENNLNKLAAANAMQISEANKQAEILITQAAEYITKQMHQAADELAASTLKLLSAQVSEANKSTSQAKRSREVATIAATFVVALLACGVVFKLFSL